MSHSGVDPAHDPLPNPTYSVLNEVPDRGEIVVQAVIPINYTTVIGLNYHLVSLTARVKKPVTSKGNLAYDFYDMSIANDVGITLQEKAVIFRRAQSRAYGLLQDIVEDTADPPTDTTETLALVDMTNGEKYKGFSGGLYTGGTNTPPNAHNTAGITSRQAIDYWDINGDPDPGGKMVFLIHGPSTAEQVACGKGRDGTDPAKPCLVGTFLEQAAQRVDLNPKMVIVNGAKEGQSMESWTPSTHSNYNRIRDNILPFYGVTEAQVGAIHMKATMSRQADRPLLPDVLADAFALQAALEAYLIAIRIRYPNLKQLYLQPRVYSWSQVLTSHSPHPWEYEEGYGVKWFIEDHIGETAPFIGWAPYLYANGNTPRNLDGLTWPEANVKADGIHPSYPIGVTIQATAQHLHYGTDPYSACWFLDGGIC